MKTKSTIEKLAEQYHKRTENIDVHSSDNMSFWSFLNSIGVEPNEKELKEVLDNLDDYFEG